MSNQEKQDLWAQYFGKWVVWSGTVRDIAPQLNPTRIVFVYKYDVPQQSLQGGEFIVAANFAPEFSAQLKQLSKGDRVYFRARLVQKETTIFLEAGRYGVSTDAGFLSLKDGQIIPNDSDIAKLVDFTYSSLEQLETLANCAEIVNNIAAYYEQKAMLASDAKRVLVKTALRLINVEVDDEKLIQAVYLPELRNHVSIMKSEIEGHLSNTLVSLHEALVQKNHSTGIQLKMGTHQRIVDAMIDAADNLRNNWEEERIASSPSMSEGILEGSIEVLSNILTKIPATSLGIGKAAAETYLEYNKIPSYYQMMGTCYDFVYLADRSMEHIYDDTIKIIDDTKN
jgi:hypothetical protein